MRKLYIVVNNKAADKGKLARACCTIGAFNPEVAKEIAIVVKGGDNYDMLEYKYSTVRSGTHIDAGHTQVPAGTSLAFGVVVEDRDDTLMNLKLL